MNYRATVRSNHFQVKDVAAFRVFCQRLGLQVTERASDQGLLHGFVAEDSDGIPTSVWEGDGPGHKVDFDFAAELADHLVAGWVAEVREVGREGTRYLAGHVLAVNSEGECRHLDLDDLREQCKAMGEHYVINSN